MKEMVKVFRKVEECSRTILHIYIDSISLAKLIHGLSPTHKMQPLLINYINASNH